MTEKIDWYDEFVDLNYNPARDDLICLYYFEPAKGISTREAMGRIASESSAGTWTTLHELPARVAKIKARAFELNGKYVKVAYPLDLWEPANAPQLLSGIAGNRSCNGRTGFRRALKKAQGIAAGAGKMGIF